MIRIKQLSAQEAQKIAAGQVVERPANVVKELVENSIDAQATHISIYIQDAGKSLIRVVDNGYGMSNQDAYECFKHHATSKITSVNDLHTLTTFGFRGEALASISAVSKATLITKQEDAMQATKLHLEAGIVQSQDFISANTGTDFCIEDLFYNVPARKKFLKSNDTELRQITLLFQAFCLDYLNIHFKLFSNSSLLFNCPPAGTMAQRVAQIWDHTIASQVISLREHYSDSLRIEGIISNHTFGRYDRSSIFFFVNNRWVKNHALSKALLKGYLNVLAPDKFPLACIAITIDPAEVDINIHPRKEEVQFLHPRTIEQALQAMVKQALENNLSAQLHKPVQFNAASMSRPNVTTSTSASKVPIAHFENYAPAAAIPHDALHRTNSDQELFTQKFFATEIPVSQPSSPFAARNTNNSVNQNINQLLPAQEHEYHIIGQLHKTYILIEQAQSFFIVDQHAAHERILYELFKERFDQVATIALLFPPIISVSPQAIALLEPYLEIFSKNNIALEIFGANQLIVQAVPVHLKEINMQELIHQAISWIEQAQHLESQDLFKTINEKLHAQMACKAAVKAGDILTQTQMQQLLTDLEKTSNRFSCPHGRPTGWDISLHEIEKKFKRKQ